MRIKRLDILRCAAVLLVIAGHSGIFPLTTKVGWVGVDLFFVLSGFLISGLLYSEYKKRGDISFRRFFIRRGMKTLSCLLRPVAGHLYWAATLLARSSPTPVKLSSRNLFHTKLSLWGVGAHVVSRSRRAFLHCARSASVGPCTLFFKSKGPIQ